MRYSFVQFIFVFDTIPNSAIALSKLFLSTDSRVQSLTVKGDLIVNQSSNVFFILFLI